MISNAQSLETGEAQPAQPDFHAIMREAHALLRTDRAEEAAAGFRQALALKPNNDAANIGLAYSLKRLGRPLEAVAVFEAVVAGNGAHDGALVGLGYTRRELGDDCGALEALARASQLNETDIALAVEVGNSAARLGRIDDALAAFGRALAREPLHFSANVALARLLKTLGRASEALTHFERALQAGGTHKGVRIERAHVLRELSRLEDAAAACRAVLAEDESYSAASIALGWILRKMGDLAGAEAAFRAVLARDPGHLGALTALGHLTSDTARADEASAMFAAAIRASPTDAALRLSYGHIARRRRDREGALASFAVAAVLEPTRTEPLLEIATELRELGRAADAHTVLDVIDMRASGEAAASVAMARALVLRSEHRREAALEAFLAIAERWPQHGAALIEAARECHALGRPEEAKRLIDRVLAVSPSDAGARLLSVDIALSGEDFEGVLALCRRGLEEAPDQIWFHLNAARGAAGLGEAAEADGFLAAARERFGDRPELVATEVEILRHRRDWTAARRLLDEHETLASDAFWLWAQRVSLAVSLGDFPAAEAGLGAIPASTRSEHARAQLLRGQLLEARRDYHGAIAAYRRASELDPGDGWTFAELARALTVSLELEEARRALDRSVELHRSANVLRGLSTKASQSHIGQLIDDFALDAALIQRLRPAWQLPPEDKVAAIAPIVREAPHSMAACLLGVIALRQAGSFEHPRDLPHARQPIPPRIFQFWDAVEPPEDIRALMASWRELNPGYEYTLLNDALAYRFLRESYPPAIARAFERSLMPAQRADLIRLAVLAKQGGYYADADDRALAPIDAFVPARSELCLYQESYGSIGNNFLGAAPGHPVLQAALEDAAAAINRGDKDIVWLSTGPGLLTRAFACYAFASDEIAPALQGISVLELWEIQRSIGFHCPVRYKATDHHWSRATFARSSRGAPGARAARPHPIRKAPMRPARQLP